MLEADSLITSFIVANSMVVNRITELNNVFRRLNFTYNKEVRIRDYTLNPDEYKFYEQNKHYMAVISKRGDDVRKRNEHNVLARKYRDLFHGNIDAFLNSDIEFFSAPPFNFDRDSVNSIITSWTEKNNIFREDNENIMYLIDVVYFSQAKQVVISSADIGPISTNARSQTVIVNKKDYLVKANPKLSSFTVSIETDLNSALQTSFCENSSISGNITSSINAFFKYFAKTFSSESSSINLRVEGCKDVPFKEALKISYFDFCRLFSRSDNYFLEIHVNKYIEEAFSFNYLFLKEDFNNMEDDRFYIRIDYGFDLNLLNSLLANSLLYCIQRYFVCYDKHYYLPDDYKKLVEELRKTAINIDGFTYKTVDDKAILLSCFKEDPEIVIPESIEILGKEYQVIEVGENAFANLSSLIEVTIPKTVWKIGQGSFKNCSRMKKIHFGNVTSIGAFSVAGCYSLKSIKIPDSVKEIGEHAFDSCFVLKNIIIPSSVDYIDKEILNMCDLCTITILGDKDISGWHPKWNRDGLVIVREN